MDIVFDRSNIGRVLDICDSIVSVAYMDNAFSGELVHFQSADSELVGFVWNLEHNVCKIPLLRGSQSTLSIGDSVHRSGSLVTMRCGFGVLGETMNPLGDILVDSDKDAREFELSRLFKTHWRAFENRAPGIVERAPVTVPFMTGIASIDSFIPIGCGQRELIIGDHNTGKTSLAITAIIHQGYRNNVICGP